MEFVTEPFALGIQQRALYGGVLAAIMSSVVGVWLVLRGMSFFGDAFVHGVLPGIAVAVLLDVSPYLGAFAAAAVMLAGVEVIHRVTALKEDTIIGLWFVGMLSLGVVIISRTDSYAGSLTGILFGDPLGVTNEQLRTQAVLAILVVGCAAVLYRPLLALAFNTAKAQALGMKPGLTHALLLALIATAIVGSFEAVGTLLVFSLLIGPPATAALISRTVPLMLVASPVIGAFSVWLGLVLSYHFQTASAATMALVSVVVFFVVLIARSPVRGAVALRARPSAREHASV